MPKKIKKIISIIGVGGRGQPDDGKFHHVFTFFFYPSLGDLINEANFCQSHSSKRFLHIKLTK